MKNIILFCVGSLLFLGFYSCTQAPPPQFANIQVNKHIFSFDHNEVTDFSIAKNDQTTTQRWTAKLQRLQQTTDNTDHIWQVTSAADGQTLIDKLADKTYILHLLDTLRTLRAKDFGSLGPLESFGLSPPQYALRWSTPQKTFEIYIGVPVSIKDSSHGTYAQGTYAWIPGEKPSLKVKPLIVTGAALRMLEHLKDFNSMRHLTLATFTSDDVDELEIQQKTHPILYAQRQSGDWADRKNRMLKQDIHSFLDKLTHIRIQEFIDDPIQNKKIISLITQTPLYKVIVKDRQGTPIDITILKTGNDIFAKTSSRPSAVFKLYANAISLFELPIKQ